MKTFITIVMILYSVTISGQIIIEGTVRDYRTKETRPYALICVDTIDTFVGTSIHKPICTTRAKEDGTFKIETKYRSKINILIVDYEHVSLTIKNVSQENKNQKIDLGDIYVPYRGLYAEGYKPPVGRTRGETRKLTRNWRKNNEPAPTNWAGYSNDFFESFKEMDSILLEYPKNGEKKEFQIKDETLIIRYEEFCKK